MDKIMDQQKMKERMTNRLNSLTDEQKEKVKACKDMNELTALLGQMGVELPDELLDAVAGGQGFDSDLDYVLFLCEVDRICMERGIHPTDWERVNQVEEEVKQYWWNNP